MAKYVPALGTRIEALEAQWFFERDDAALLTLIEDLDKQGVAQVAAGMSASALPLAAVQRIGDYFVAHCKRWSGVYAPPEGEAPDEPDADSKPWTCSEENRQAIPLLDRFVVTAVYLDKAGDELGNALSGTLTNSLPPVSAPPPAGDSATTSPPPGAEPPNAAAPEPSLPPE